MENVSGDGPAELAAAFRALGDANRVRIISIIAAKAPEQTCVCELPEPLELSQPTVSHHLKILVEAGILDREKRGVWVYFSLRQGALEAIAAQLMALNVRPQISV